MIHTAPRKLEARPLRRCIPGVRLDPLSRLFELLFLPLEHRFRFLQHLECQHLGSLQRAPEILVRVLDELLALLAGEACEPLGDDKA